MKESPMQTMRFWPAGLSGVILSRSRRPQWLMWLATRPCSSNQSRCSTSLSV
ncbi:MAG: hypothetical protein R3F29_05205 [Planctomycetota bacterium]